ncbi:resolvase [Capsulimonas corticalis]|uniref:Resolvase n=1 Tax=Capsulimonas corticalis TaxID=2219043 RepID=A0A402CYQ6_9BACT|nr:pre-16S rRNA-processing nuclease YqgF [Capsulimonas corticalis]BDI31238.1 resolvase [Capsulimonas corticalis]
MSDVPTNDLLAIETILSIDPGRAKCGVAVVEGPAPIAVKRKLVVDSLKLVSEILAIREQFPAVSRLIIGDGTGSATLRRALAASMTDLPIEVVDEYCTSQRARERFTREIRPVGWLRLVPKTLRAPHLPYDDYVAVILAEDYFAKKNV